MPAAITHYLLAQRVLAQLEAAGTPVASVDAFLWGAQGPDFLFTHRYLPWQKGKSLFQLGLRLHQGPPAELMRALRRGHDQAPGDIARSYLYGFLCHYVLDRTAHPYVNSCAVRLLAEDPTQDQNVFHNEVESALDTILLRSERSELPVDFDLKKTVPKNDAVQHVISALYSRSVPGTAGELVPEVLFFQATADCRLTFGLLNDRTGMKRAVVRRLEHGKRTLSSHVRPMTEEGEFDYANILYTPWSWEGVEGTESFFDLFQRAVTEAVDLIGRFFETSDYHAFTGDRNFEGRKVL